MVRRTSTLTRVRARRVANRARSRAAVRRRMRPIASQAAAVARLMRSRRRPLSAFVPRRPRGSTMGRIAAMMRGTRTGTGLFRRPRVGRVVR